MGMRMRSTYVRGWESIENVPRHPGARRPHLFGRDRTLAEAVVCFTPRKDAARRVSRPQYSGLSVDCAQAQVVPPASPPFAV